MQVETKQQNRYLYLQWDTNRLIAAIKKHQDICKNLSISFKPELYIGLTVDRHKTHEEMDACPNKKNHRRGDPALCSYPHLVFTPQEVKGKRINYIHKPEGIFYSPNDFAKKVQDTLRILNPAFNLDDIVEAVENRERVIKAIDYHVYIMSFLRKEYSLYHNEGFGLRGAPTAKELFEIVDTAGIEARIDRLQFIDQAYYDSRDSSGGW